MSQTLPERWRDIPGWEGYYEASTTGRVRSKSRTIETSDGVKVRYRSRELKSTPDARGRLRVKLCKGNKGHTLFIHKVIAETFIPNPDNLPVVRHLNAIKTHCPKGHEYSESNTQWGKGKRNCKICKLEWQRSKKGV